jgi:antirestriction protein ArdC
MSKVYEIITEKILGLLESGTVPWRMPWKAGNDSPINYMSGRAYRGINPWLLNAAAIERGFNSNLWLTAKQIFSLKGHFKDGESKQYTIVVFWKLLEKKKEDSEEDSKVKQVLPVLRYFRVYNINQTEGIGSDELAVLDEQPFHAIPFCESIVEGYTDRPEIHLRGDRAFYQPSSDRIQIPPPNRFDSPEEYYSTLFHELTHSTGHKNRLNRKGVDGGFHFFGDEIYSKEELVAEFGASFLCAKAGIEPAVLENQASYIHGWSRKLKDDPRAVVVAAGQAQKAAEYILENCSS